MSSRHVNVWYGTKDHEWLSNLCYRPFWWDKKWYVSVEHAYQTWKSGSFDRRVYSRPWQSGSKFVGKNPPLTDNDWNIGLMTNLIIESFLDPMNASMRAKFKEYIREGVTFTHVQDRGIWRTMFPICLQRAGEYLVEQEEHILCSSLSVADKNINKIGESHD